MVAPIALPPREVVKAVGTPPRLRVPLNIVI
jgi:hypothetical protein